MTDATHFPRLTKAELWRVRDLKTQQEPSYVKVYKDFLGLLSSKDGAPQAFLARLSTRAMEGSETEARALQFVVKELPALEYVSGGSRVLGLKNVRGYVGGAQGYRHSVRVEG